VLNETVSGDAQKNFIQHMDRIDKASEKSPSQFNKDYYSEDNRPCYRVQNSRTNGITAKLVS